MHETVTPGPVIVPSQCPKCRSLEVTTVSKVVSAESYWRCAGCGEVWNAGRRREQTGYRPTRPGWR
jgi:transposase-like protein